MSDLHDVLTRIDRALDSMLSAPVEDQERKMRIFDEMCHNTDYSEDTIFQQVDNWLQNCNKAEKTQFCEFIYDGVANQTMDDCGRDMIKEYCKLRLISLR